MKNLILQYYIWHKYIIYVFVLKKIIYHRPLSKIFWCLQNSLKLRGFLQGIKRVKYPFHYFRYVGIVKPKKNSNLSKYKSTKVQLIVIILITFLFELPLYFEFEVQELNCKNETVLSRWPQDWTENEVYQHLYKSALYPLFRRFLPLMLTSILTYKLVRFLIERGKSTENIAVNRT